MLEETHLNPFFAMTFSHIFFRGFGDQIYIFFHPTFTYLFMTVNNLFFLDILCLRLGGKKSWIYFYHLDVPVVNVNFILDQFLHVFILNVPARRFLFISPTNTFFFIHSVAFKTLAVFIIGMCIWFNSFFTFFLDRHRKFLRLLSCIAFYSNEQRNFIWQNSLKFIENPVL